MALIGDFGYDDRYGIALAGLFMISFIFFVVIDTSSIAPMFQVMAVSAPVWLPVISFYLFFEIWLMYVRLKFDIDQDWRTTLEIRIPQEILKSPEAMELVIIQLHQLGSADNHLQTYVDGKHPPITSLEIASHGGNVKFYINVPVKKFKNLVETQLYAQYPGVEVHELDIDYTASVPHDLSEHNMISFHIGLKKADAYPLKTYIDFGLDQMPKEEEKVDPISSLIEMMGNISPHEEVWFQILIDANRKETLKEGKLTFGEVSDWTVEARMEINKIMAEAGKRVGVDADRLKETGGNVNQFLTDSEKDKIKAIERSTSKNAFNTGIRFMYICHKDGKFNADRITAMLTTLRNYDDNNRNMLGVRWRTDVDWKWQDRSGAKVNRWKKEELINYKKRHYFHYASFDKKKIMTTEELATIFHLPGKVVTTPTLGRIPSKRSEAPSNLPIG